MVRAIKKAWDGIKCENCKKNTIRFTLIFILTFLYICKFKSKSAILITYDEEYCIEIHNKSIILYNSQKEKIHYYILKDQIIDCELGDIDGDNFDELVLISKKGMGRFGGKVIIFKIKEKIEKLYQEDFSILKPWKVALGDVDGDGRLEIYGNEPDLNRLKDENKLEQLYEEVKKLPEPKIKPKYTTVTTPVGKQFRFMGQRYILDAEIIQELVEPIIRPIPSGLDVMGVLGSERAKEIQLEKEVNQDWDEYSKEFDRLKDEFNKLEDEEWRANMYQGWLWTLKELLKPYGKGYPSFMTNEAWVDKNLVTALASWVELKHDTILYGKQSGAEMGGGYGEPIEYVEPNIEVYEKLLWLIRFSKENLKERDLLIENVEGKIEEFEELLEFLIQASVKQLNNQELTEEEYYRIVYYGGFLERLSCSLVEGNLGYWHEITSETDRNMALIADFHTIAPNSYSYGGYLEAAVGPASEIYAVIPIGDKLYLTRGAVFSYYEFISDERLTDEKWQEMLKEEKAPPMPEWTNSFIRGGKGDIPYLEEY